MIGIIGAMEEEIQTVLALMIEIKEQTIGNTHFYQGQINQHPVVLIQSGIGKVNAAIATTLLLEHYAITSVINIGTAGGLATGANVLDVVISTEVGHHDVDVTAFDYEVGQVPQLPRYFKSDSELIKKVRLALDAIDVPFHEGLIVSGDEFVHTPDRRETILSQFPNAIALEMEAAAIAQTCHLFGVPFIVLRSLSDIAGESSHLSFDEYIHQAASQYARLIKQLCS